MYERLLYLVTLSVFLSVASADDVFMKRRRETSSLPSSHPSLPLILLVCANQCAINPIVSTVTGPECQKSEGKLFTGTKSWAEAAAAPSCCCQAAAPQHADTLHIYMFYDLKEHLKTSVFLLAENVKDNKVTQLTF